MFRPGFGMFLLPVLLIIALLSVGVMNAFAGGPDVQPNGGQATSCTVKDLDGGLERVVYFGCSDLALADAYATFLRQHPTYYERYAKMLEANGKTSGMIINFGYS
ncbi:MAG: hypothetical protein M1150_02995 [Patescibacteria group bacterium]|nr:hypothetical protein [Patescibacteria group bacterium]